MKKILAFNDYYIPATDVGGPVTSINNASKALKKEFEFYIEAYNHNFSDNIPFENINTNEWYRVGDANVMYHADGELDFNYKNTEKFIKDVNPDVMWFSGLLMPNKLHNAIKIGEKLNIPVVISPRGEASPDRMAIKGYKKIPYALLITLLGIYKKKNVYFHVTSDDEIVGLRKYFKINPGRITKVANIGVVPVERKMTYEKKSGEIRIMFISRIHKVKNLHIAIQIVNQLKGKVTFDIYGPIESKEYWAQCENLIKSSPDNVKIKYCGKVSPDKVDQVYSNYDCFLFPTVNENYGHVIAEALANGCPVVLSRGTTPWDDLHNIAGYVCSLDCIDEFIDTLNKIIEFDDNRFRELVNNTYRYYCGKTRDDNAIDGHIEMFKKIIEQRNLYGGDT